MIAKSILSALILTVPFLVSARPTTTPASNNEPSAPPPIVRQLNFNYRMMKGTITQDGDINHIDDEEVCRGSIPAPIFDYRNYPDSPGMFLSVDDLSCQSTAGGEPVTIHLNAFFIIQNFESPWTPPNEKAALSSFAYAFIRKTNGGNGVKASPLNPTGSSTRDLNSSSIIGSISPDRMMTCQNNPDGNTTCTYPFPEFFYISFETTPL